MKTLIIYASKYGCTEDCAKYLKSKMQGETMLVDINKQAKQIELGGFDTVIIGGSVYVGKVAKKLRAFCQGNLDGLSDKRLGIFFCCGRPQEMDEVLAANFPAGLVKAAMIIKSFGSEARLAKMTFFDKTILNAVTKGDYSSFKISNDSMDEFIKALAP